MSLVVWLDELIRLNCLWWSLRGFVLERVFVFSDMRALFWASMVCKTFSVTVQSIIYNSQWTIWLFHIEPQFPRRYFPFRTNILTTPKATETWTALSTNHHGSVARDPCVAGSHPECPQGAGGNGVAADSHWPGRVPASEQVPGSGCRWGATFRHGWWRGRGYLAGPPVYILRPHPEDLPSLSRVDDADQILHATSLAAEKGECLTLRPEPTSTFPLIS